MWVLTMLIVIVISVMRKVTGMIDEFKKMNIAERLEKDFYELNSFRQANNYIRKRAEPLNVIQNSIDENNDFIHHCLKYHQTSVDDEYQKSRRDYKDHTQGLIQFEEQIYHNLNQSKSYIFSGELHSPPQKLTKAQEEETTEQMKSQVQITKYVKSKEKVYDFDKINDFIREDKDELLSTAVNEGDIPLMEDLRAINRLNEVEEISKTFHYSLKEETLESKLKRDQLFQMALHKDSIVVRPNSSIQVEYIRDLGETGRRPVLDLRGLTSAELTVVPTHLRYCDLMGIASGRLVKENIGLCIRNSASTKQEL